MYFTWNSIMDRLNESELSEVESNFFDRITDLLATNLWREATMILEVVVKFNNNSSESASLLFSPDPNIQPSPRKGILSLDPACLESKNEFLDEQQNQYKYPTLNSGFQPNKIPTDMPPFSPNNVRTKSLQQQRRNNIQLRRRHSADDTTALRCTPISNKHTTDNDNNMALPWTPEDEKPMVSAALASWNFSCIRDKTGNKLFTITTK